MMSVVLGSITAIAGFLGILYWSADFLSILKGLIPLSFLCGGLIAIIAGLSSLKK